jgi:hypothetical protein
VKNQVLSRVCATEPSDGWHPEYLYLWCGSPKGRHHLWKGRIAMFQPVGLIWGIVTLIFGIFILVYPRLLNYAVGIYLIIVGLWAIIPRLHF